MFLFNNKTNNSLINLSFKDPTNSFDIACFYPSFHIAEWLFSFRKVNHWEISSVISVGSKIWLQAIQVWKWIYMCLFFSSCSSPWWSYDYLGKMGVERGGSKSISFQWNYLFLLLHYWAAEKVNFSKYACSSA